MIQEVLDVIQALEGAANQADPSKAEAVLWLDDDRFCEIEDFIPEPFGAGVVRDIHSWIRENGKPGDNVRFVQVKVYPLAPDVAYATAIQELNFDQPSKSRVTFVLPEGWIGARKGDRWGVIHAHYSAMPVGEG
jgi:hypothetical protein